MSSIVINTLRGGSALRSWLIALLLLAAAPATWAGVTVAVTAPTDGAILNPVQGIPTSITLQATASANQGYTVSKVEFFHGSTLIGTDTTSPYSFSWTNVPPGSYALTAKATAIKKNSADQTATSASVNIIVNALPVISMTSPAAAQTTLPIPPPPLTLSATATDSDGTIAKVEFWQDTTVIATVTSAPYSFVWNIPPPYVVDGVPKWYVIYAVATDNRGGVTFAEIAKDVFFAPTIALTSPANGASYAAPAAITLNASVSPTDFPIAKMQFYNGTTLIGEDLTSPYSFNWENVGVGSYSLTAVAVGSSAPSEWASSPVNVTVTAASVEPKLHFIHVDHLNTPRLVANAAGTTVWQWDQTEPFGNNPANENPGGAGIFDMPLRFPGQYFDKETNFHYNYFRDYDPSIGRYTESDPIGLRAGLNTYAYVASDPLKYIDREGLDRWGDDPAFLPYGPLSREHLERNRLNRCPKCEPKDGADCIGNKWSQDWIGGFFYHGGLQGNRTYRALDPSSPGSGFQCVYDSQGTLVTSGPTRGTYDYITPSYSIGGHRKYDVIPHQTNSRYQLPDQTRIICDKACCP